GRPRTTTLLRRTRGGGGGLRPAPPLASGRGLPVPVGTRARPGDGARVRARTHLPSAEMSNARPCPSLTAGEPSVGRVKKAPSLPRASPTSLISRIFPSFESATGIDPSNQESSLSAADPGA